MKTVKKILNNIFIDGLSGMALGLFSTLIIGTILKQIGDLLGGTYGSYLSTFAVIAQRLTGAGIGIGVAYKFRESTYVLLSAAAAGMIGAYASSLIAGTLLSDTGALVLSGPGEPLGAFVAAYVGITAAADPYGNYRFCCNGNGTYSSYQFRRSWNYSGIKWCSSRCRYCWLLLSDDRFCSNKLQR